VSVAYASATTSSPWKGMGRARQTVFALTVASALNGLVLLSLVIDHEAKFKDVSSDAIQVNLVPRFRMLPREKPHARPPPNTPASPPKASGETAPAPPLMAPIPRLSGPPETAEPVDLMKLRSMLRSRSGCLSATHLTVEEQENCAEFLSSARDKGRLLLGLGRDYEFEAKRKEAISDYRRSSDKRYFPGLGATLGRSAPLKPEDPDPLDIYHLPRR